MTTNLWDEFPASELKSFRGRGGMDLTYVEDETVMDRLDGAVQVLHWDWHVEMVGPDVVKGRLRITWTEGGESEWEDFGYANNANSAEPLKEAATDAFRRVARMPGVARYVYAGKAPAPRRTAPAPRVTEGAPSVAAQVRDDALVAAVALAEPPEPVWTEPENVTAAMQLADELPDAVPHCPVHKKPMRASTKWPGFYCSQRNPDGTFCDKKAA